MLAFVSGAARGQSMQTANGPASPGESCTTATTIEGQGMFPFDNSGLLDTDPPDSGAACGSFLNSRWHCWTAPCDGPVSVDTFGTTTMSTGIGVYEGCACPPSEDDVLECTYLKFDRPWGSVSFQSFLTFNATAGQEYLIRVGSDVWGGLYGGAGQFTVQCADEPSPSCRRGEAYCRPPDTWNALRSTGSDARVAAQFSVAADGALFGVCWWGTYIGDDTDCRHEIQDAFEVRYYVDAGGVPGALLHRAYRQSNGTLVVTGPDRTGRFTAETAHEYDYSARHAPIQLRGGHCYWIEIVNPGSATCQWHWSVTANQQERTLQDGSYGQAVDGYGLLDAVADGTAFCLNLELADAEPCASVPANDNCADAAPITDGTYVFDTAQATTDYPLDQYLHYCPPRYEDCCNLPLGDETLHRDVWFDYVPVSDGVLKLEVTGGLFDSKIAVYEGNDCPPDDYACNDDAFGQPDVLSPRVAVPVLAGEEYKVAVGGFADSGGIGTLEVALGQAPANDDCGYVESASLPALFTGSNEFATDDRRLYPCNASPITGDNVWLAFTLDEMGALVIDYSGSPDSFADAWGWLVTDCTCNTTSAPADYRMQGPDGNPIVAWDCLPAGTYYYPVTARPGSTGSYSIAVDSSSCTSPCAGAQGPCVEGHDAPGCGDHDCCQAVCAFDSYCCGFVWDDFCARTAVGLCGIAPEDVCAAAIDACDSPHATPGCSDPSTCMRVCACDPFCCAIAWDQDCVFTGTPNTDDCGGALDCNSNAELDAEELANGTATDCNTTDVIDDCESTAPGDFTADGVIDLLDVPGLVDCADGPNHSPDAGDGTFDCTAMCLSAFDHDGDLDVDLRDLAHSQRTFGTNTE